MYPNAGWTTDEEIVAASTSADAAAMLMCLSATRNGSSAGIEPCAMSVNM